MRILSVYELEQAWRHWWVSSSKPKLDSPVTAFGAFTPVVISALRYGRGDQRTRDGVHEAYISRSQSGDRGATALNEYERGELHSSLRSRADLRRFQRGPRCVLWPMISSDGLPCGSTASLIAGRA